MRLLSVTASELELFGQNFPTDAESLFEEKIVSLMSGTQMHRASIPHVAVLLVVVVLVGRYLVTLVRETSNRLIVAAGSYSRACQSGDVGPSPLE